MSSGDAVRAALHGLIEPRGVTKAAKVMGIPGSTLRNVLEGQKTVTDDLLRKIRRLPGFSERYDGITGAVRPDVDAMIVGERLLRAYPGVGGGMIVYALENLAGHVDAEAVANTLNSLAKVLREHTPRPTPPNKFSKSG